MKQALDNLKRTFEELLRENSFEEMVEWCNEHGLALASTRIDAGVTVALGGLCGSLARAGVPPAVVGAYVAAMIQAVNAQEQN